MTRTTRSTISFIVCLIVALLAIGALAWATSGFKNWDAATWFNSWGKGAAVTTTTDQSENELDAAPDNTELEHADQDAEVSE